MAFKLRSSGLPFRELGSSPAKQEKKEEEEVVEAHNQKLADYLTSDGKKTIRGGIKAARQGIAEQDGPKLGGLLKGIFGGGK